MRHPVVVTVLCLCSLVPIVAALSVEHRLLGDDPLITLTYAKNISVGNGFVFNQGDPVLGTTTPLFALVVGLLMAVLPVPGTAIAVWLSALCWVGLIWSLYVCRDAFRIPAGLAAWIGATITASGWVAHLGMEAYPFALLLVATLGAVYGGRPLLAGVLGGLLFLTRGEGILLFGLAAAAGTWIWWRDDREDSTSLLRMPPFLMAAGFLIPLGLWSLYAMPTFGNIFPNTLAAKIAQVDSGLWPAFQTRLIGDWVPGWKIGPSLGPALFNVFFLLAIAGLVRAAREHPRLLILPVWGLAYGAGYALLGVPGYPWYRLPIEFVLIVLVGIGLGGLAALCGADHTQAWRRRAAFVPGAVAIVVLALGGSLEDIRRPPVHDKDRAYLKMAEWFDTHGTEGERIAYMEIGYLGYYTDLGIVDLVGLVTPEITSRVAARDFTSGFWELEPEYLVSLERSRFILPILDNPEFAPRYERVAELDGFDGLGLSVFRRYPD
ncbi:MAG: hypothetical protein GTN89_10075 [Acidobacteria bacterium]|nr:hypothetical protein [Acidobacteriota bacterium]NIM61230.1 hypothetical protein [Acidobacteriota bacterium]NIO59608.1 hypothetical protein [Acidobacteriota bacterium]NIQ30701.1 hypothetical protein [Acidobacteriota bacterium]NIQ85674.1 hypothetical protein [Acidobacteriota bacterium]